jgi:hypothetical protein
MIGGGAEHGEGKGRGLEGGLFIKCRVVFSRRGLVRSVRDLAHSFFILFLLLLFPCLGWVVDLIYWLFFLFFLRGGFISLGLYDRNFSTKLHEECKIVT